MEGKVSQGIVFKVQDFLQNSFYPILHHFCKRHFLFIPNGDRDHNSAVESDNKSLKHCQQRPQPNHNLFWSGKMVLERDERYINRLVDENRKKVVYQLFPCKGETSKGQLARELSAHIVEPKAKDAAEQWELANTASYQTSVGYRGENEDGLPFQQFYVRSIFPPIQTSIVPKYHRTRCAQV